KTRQFQRGQKNACVQRQLQITNQRSVRDVSISPSKSTLCHQKVMTSSVCFCGSSYRQSLEDLQSLVLSYPQTSESGS
ncbi:hypothetical protein BgiBS90_011970, partial [Biomphalaria glabrata]